ARAMVCQCGVRRALARHRERSAYGRQYATHGSSLWTLERGSVPYATHSKLSLLTRRREHAQPDTFFLSEATCRAYTRSPACTSWCTASPLACIGMFGLVTTVVTCARAALRCAKKAGAETQGSTSCCRIPG